MMLFHGLTPASSCIGSVAPQQGLLCMPKLAIVFDHLGKPGRSYKAVCRGLLLVLNLEVSGRSHARIMAVAAYLKFQGTPCPEAAC